MNFRLLAGATGAILILGANFALASGDSWKATSTAGAPQGREEHTAVWTGSKMIVWGGYATSVGKAVNTGAIYDPVTNSWTPVTTTNAPARRDNHTAVWTGSKMIVWGGDSGADSKVLGDGAAYDPVSNSWAPISRTNAPSPRYAHIAVWTGSKMIVWGGWSSILITPPRGSVNTGGIYDPETDTWTPISTVNAPPPRGHNMFAVWTGSKMVVWGGDEGDSNFTDFNTGGIYDPETDSWTATALANAPAARDDGATVWTGSKMIVWSGYGNVGPALNTGGVFDPVANDWKPAATASAPSARAYDVAAWTGSRMIVWSGSAETSQTVFFGNGALYDPVTDSWSAMTSAGAPAARDTAVAVWTGTSMIVWGGYDGHNDVNTGGIYTPPALPCPVGGARQCVLPVAGASDVRSAGRSHSK